MFRSTAYGLPVQRLNVVVVEDSRPMQEVIRSILSSMRVERVRVFSNADEALKSMSVEPPNLIISDWRMQPLSGYNLLKIVRHKSMMPLCFVPVMMVSGHATPDVVDKAFRAGAQQFIVKPISPATIFKRIEMVLNDDRLFQLEDEHYVVRGVSDKLDEASQHTSLAKQIHLDRLVHFREQRKASRQHVKDEAHEPIDEASAIVDLTNETDTSPFYENKRMEAAAKLAEGKPAPNKARSGGANKRAMFANAKPRASAAKAAAKPLHADKRDDFAEL